MAVFFPYPASQPARHVARTAQSPSQQMITWRYCRKMQNVGTLNAVPTQGYGLAVAKYIFWMCGVFLAHSFTLYSEHILPRTHAHTHTHTHTKEQRERIWIEGSTQQATLGKVNTTKYGALLPSPRRSLLSKCHTLLRYMLQPTYICALTQVQRTLSRFLPNSQSVNLYLHTLYRILYNSDKIPLNVAQHSQ